MPAKGQTTPVMTRLMAKVRRDANGCWTFTGAHVRDYGMIWDAGGQRRAHRVTYELFVGPIPKGLHLDHLCRNTRCVNPEHLEPVTSRENTMRGNTLAAANVAKTHCPQQHPYAGANLYHYPDGRRVCRTCRAERKRRRRAEAAA